jgi:hypothetical protein
MQHSDAEDMSENSPVLAHNARISIARPAHRGDSRTDSGSGFLRADEGAVSPAWYVTAGAGGVTEVREPMTRQFRQELMAEQFDQESKEPCRNSKFIR